MDWIADVIGIVLVFFLVWFFVEGMFPDTPPKRPMPTRKDKPVTPKWR